MIKKLSLSFFLGTILLLNSCDSTGICTKPVTPKLMIGFSKLDNLGNPKDIDPPKDLKIYGIKDGVEIFIDGTEPQYLYPDLTQTDEDKRVALIFDVNRDSLTYIFKFDSGNDTLKMKYIRNNRYVNKDCGYKTVFNNVELEYYSTHVIDSIALLTETIDYDTEQHIQLFNK